MHACRIWSYKNRYLFTNSTHIKRCCQSICTRLHLKGHKEKEMGNTSRMVLGLKFADDWCNLSCFWEALQ